MQELSIFVLGVVAGTIAAFGLDIFRAWYFSPRLKIEEVSVEEGPTHSVVSVIIHNGGRRAAVGAQGSISVHNLSPRACVEPSKVLFTRDAGLDAEKWGIDSARPETVYLSNVTFRPINQEPLSWASVDSRRAADLYPGQSRLLDICRILESPQGRQVQIPTGLGWQHLLVALLPGQYDIDVHVAAHESPGDSRRYRLSTEPTPTLSEN